MYKFYIVNAVMAVFLCLIVLCVVRCVYFCPSLCDLLLLFYMTVLSEINDFI